jgi:hypothetical protein
VQQLLAPDHSRIGALAGHSAERTLIVEHGGVTAVAQDRLLRHRRSARGSSSCGGLVRNWVWGFQSHQLMLEPGTSWAVRPVPVSTNSVVFSDSELSGLVAASRGAFVTARY